MRLHDNYVMDYALKHQAKNKEVLPVYCFDPRFLTRKVQKWNTQKCGLIRTRFLLETADNLRENLKGINSNLLVSTELPEDFLPKLLEEGVDTTVVYQEEICSEELRVEKAVKEALQGKAEVKSLWGSTLYNIEDLPFKPAELPHIYGKFREKSEGVKVRKLVPTPKKNELPFPSKPSKIIQGASKFMPTLKDFGFTKEEIETPKDKRACYDFIGGEDAGLKRCEEYIMGTQSVGQYNATRN